ncbi:PAS domain S-box protein [Saccharicrinis sp. FJH2]|uniref:PAS domain S-box protein n=1 Tax=Saccharicrinis sp. FJH65 TaxID=3344659 RepID=UPI0035F31041
MTQEFIKNATLLITLSFLYGIIRWYRGDLKKMYHPLSGLLFGLIAVAAMMTPFVYTQGTIYDGRSVVLTLAGLWGGGYTVLISAVISSAYRIYLGGAGVVPGLATIVFCSGTGLLFRYFFKEKLTKLSFWHFLFIGVIAHIVMLASQVLHPVLNFAYLMEQLWLPVLTIFPIAFAIISKVIQLTEKYIANYQSIIDSEALYHTTLLSIGDAVICTDEKGMITQMNDVAEKLTGWNINSAKGKNLETVFHIIDEESHQKAESIANKVIKSGTIMGLADHTLLISKDGNEFPVADSGAPIKNKDGKIIGVVIVFRDQTEERRYQKVLIESEARYKEREFWLRESQRVGKIGTYDLNILNNHWTSSEVLDDIFGITRDNPHNVDSWNDMIHPDHREKMIDYFLNYVVKGKHSFEKEYRIIRQNDQKTRWVVGHGELEFNEEGDPVRMIGTIQDVTDRKNYEIQLEESEKSYRNLFENHSAVKLLIDPETGNIVHANKAASDFYGWSINELEQMNIGDINPISQEEVYNNMQNALKERRLYFELKHRLANGEIRDVEVYTSKSEYRGRVLLHSIIHDITDKKKLLEDLVIAKEKAEESERLKSAFLANMSHEIRTPLNGILGFTNLLTENNTLTKENKKEFGRIINKSAEGLLKIINDILDISRLETGKLVIDQSIFDVGIMLSNINSIYQNKIRESNKPEVEINLIKPDHQIFVKSDENRITQVITNLLDNAIRFTHKGNIDFGLRIVSSTTVEFFVSDTGIGIPDDKQKLIFERFSQADDNTTRSYGGTGLGLAIVKRLTELMGCEINLESKHGAGSKFWFQMPVVVPKNSMKPEEISVNGLKNVQLSSEKILVVEDDPASKAFYEEVLQESFSNIFYAENGQKAMMLYSTKKPDIILMDIGLPDINGLDLVRKIREKDLNVIIIAQTAYALPDDEQKALKAGCNGYIPKPIKKDQLIQTIKNYL